MSISKNKAFTLLELLVALFLSTIALLLLYQIWAYTSKLLISNQNFNIQPLLIREDICFFYQVTHKNILKKDHKLIFQDNIFLPLTITIEKKNNKFFIKEKFVYGDSYLWKGKTKETLTHFQDY